MTRWMGSGRRHSVCSDAYPVFTSTVRTYKTRYDVGRVHVLVSNFLGYVSTKNNSKMGWNLTKMSQK